MDKITSSKTPSKQSSFENHSVPQLTVFKGTNALLSLQRLIGNRAVQQLLHTPAKKIQRVIGLPNDNELISINFATGLIRRMRTALGPNAGAHLVNRLNSWATFLNGVQDVLTASLNVINAQTNIHTFIDTLNLAQMHTTLAKQLFPNVNFEELPNLAEHVQPLITSMWGIYAEAESSNGSGANTFGEGSQYVANPQNGEPQADCLAAGNLNGLRFDQINNNATQNGGNLLNEEIGSNGARSRLVWRWGDGSYIALDVPGEGAGEKYEVSYTPHLHKVSADGFHLSDAGIGVPVASHPAHITFNYKHYSLKTYIEQNGGSVSY